MSEPTPINPYAAPAAELIPLLQVRLARIEKKFLVVPKDWQSPRICLVTGSTVDLLPKRRRLAWLHPAWLLLFLLLRFFSLLILVFLQRGGRINYYLSREAASRQRKRLLINWSIFLAGIVASVLGYKSVGGAAILIFVGSMLVILSAVLGITMCRRFYARRIAGNFIWLAGLRPEVMREIVRLEEQQLDQRQPVAPAWTSKAAPSAPSPVPW